MDLFLVHVLLIVKKNLQLPEGTRWKQQQLLFDLYVTQDTMVPENHTLATTQSSLLFKLYM